jgi:hypothetical protein
MKALTLLILALIALSGCAMIHNMPAEATIEDFTDSGVGCVDDCLDPADEEDTQIV